MLKTYKIICLSTALSPISHMSGTAGNVGIIAREWVMTRKGKLAVPMLSGNAIRHRCVREPGMRWLIDLYGLRGTLTLPVQNFLYHGGNLTESNAHENTARIATMHHAWPLLRLLGGCLPNQILTGALDTWRGALVCEENRDYLQAVAGDVVPSKRLKPAEEVVGNFQYTRGDAAKRGEAITTEEIPSNLMIYSGQAVNRGAMFLHGFLLKHVNRVELGAMLLSLRLWQEQGGTVGGNGRVGHGRFRTEILMDGQLEKEAVAEYVECVQGVKQDALDWLREAFEKKEKAAKKAKAKT